MKKGEKIKYAIFKEVSSYSFREWLEVWEIDKADWDKFMEAGRKALDELEAGRKALDEDKSNLNVKRRVK